MPERSRPPTWYEDAYNFFFFTPELNSAIYTPKQKYEYPRAPNLSDMEYLSGSQHRHVVLNSKVTAWG